MSLSFSQYKMTSIHSIFGCDCLVWFCFVFSSFIQTAVIAMTLCILFDKWCCVTHWIFLFTNDWIFIMNFRDFFFCFFKFPSNIYGYDFFSYFLLYLCLVSQCLCFVIEGQNAWIASVQLKRFRTISKKCCNVVSVFFFFVTCRKCMFWWKTYVCEWVRQLRVSNRIIVQKRKIKAKYGLLRIATCTFGETVVNAVGRNGRNERNWPGWDRWS